MIRVRDLQFNFKFNFIFILIFVIVHLADAFIQFDLQLRQDATEQLRFKSLIEATCQCLDLASQPSDQISSIKEPSCLPLFYSFSFQ